MFLVGCGQSEVRFALNREGQPPPKDDKAKQTRAVHDRAIVNVLHTMFGTPDAPAAWGGSGVSGLDERKLRLAAGPADDPQGRGLYRKHCVHCHGVTGDGNGPTAAFLNPYPRDFRRSLFKFKSTYPDGAKPTREDLMRTIREGINGTAMPSFKVLLRGDEIEALAEYVVYLTMRGRTEILLRDPEQNDSGLVMDANFGTVEDLSEEAYQKLIAEAVATGELEMWTQAPQQVFVPPERDEARIAAVDGAKLFAGTRARTATCASSAPNATGSPPSATGSPPTRPSTSGTSPSGTCGSPT